MTTTTTLTTRLLSLGLDTDQAELTSSYINLLMRVNRKISLTSVNSFDPWFVSHVEDSIKAYKYFNALSPRYFIDSGSGNGLPGVIFAILSDLPFTLCDVDAKKCEFLKTAVFRLGLKGKVHCGPIEDLAKDLKEGTCFVYRGLGPDHFLEKQFELAGQADHFRFVSSTQPDLFKGSTRQKYKLSDKSERFLEVSQGK